jgi:excinuclease ABC subunit C
VLDDFAGLGPVRRAALLAHFGSIDRLRAASAAEISEVGGFGGKMAAELHAFLNRPALPEETNSADSEL